MKIRILTITLILVVVVVIVIIYLFFKPVEVNDRLTKERMQCNSNIIAITEEIVNYIDEHDVFPDTLDDIFGTKKNGLEDPLTREKYSLFCPLSEAEYIYSKPVSLEERDHVFLYCPAHKIKKSLDDFEEDRKSIYNTRVRVRDMLNRIKKENKGGRSSLP